MPNFKYLAYNTKGREISGKTSSRDENEALVGRFLQGHDLGFIGEPRMNVLSLHVALGRDFPMRGKGDKRRVAGKGHDWQLHTAAAILGLARRCRTNG